MRTRSGIKDAHDAALPGAHGIHVQGGVHARAVRPRIATSTHTWGPEHANEIRVNRIRSEIQRIGPQAQGEGGTRDGTLGGNEDMNTDVIESGEGRGKREGDREGGAC